MKMRLDLQHREILPHFKDRTYCTRCLQPDFSCYCQGLSPFDPGAKFVILIHPIEFHRRIATGRMSHLMLLNSELLMGHDYTGHERVNSLIADPRFHPVVLYPGPNSINLSRINALERRQIFPTEKIPLLFVVDGTWNTAKKTMHLSKNLKILPRISFDPPTPSAFKVRKQPRPECYSTLEAIHCTLDLLGDAFGLDDERRPHDELLRVFENMVAHRLELRRRGRTRAS